MKKTLLLATFIGGCIFINAQTLQTDDFSTLIVGNVGTDMTGVTPGQGGYLTFSSSGANSDWQIVDDGGEHDNVFQLTGPPSATTATKFMWKDGLATAWGTRISGNDIIEIEFDIFTGPSTTSKNGMGVRLFNPSGQTVAGFQLIMETKILSGIARYGDMSNPVNSYAFNLGAGNTALTLTANTWYRLGFAFDKTTGDVTWKGPGFYTGVTGTEIGVNPDEVDFLATTGTANASASVAKFDNLTIKATSVESLLGIEDVIADSAAVIKLYPNPVNDVLVINASNISISNMEIMDLNGRIVKSVSANNAFEARINVSDLSAGVYMINVYSENNKTTKKFVKN